MARHVCCHDALLHPQLKQILILRGQATYQLHLLDHLETLCKVILLLHSNLSVKGKSVGLYLDMICIVEAIMAVVVTRCSDESSRLLNRTQLQLSGETVGARLQ